MRIADPTGPWKAPAGTVADGQRDPAETGGVDYRLLTEGRIENYDGHTIGLRPLGENPTSTATFLADCAASTSSTARVDFPASEPEILALIDFMVGHSNVYAGIALHSYSRVFLRPYAYQADEAMATEDLWAFETIGAARHAITGYPAVRPTTTSAITRKRSSPALWTTGSTRNSACSPGRWKSGAAAPGGHRRIQIHRLVPRTSARR